MGDPQHDWPDEITGAIATPRHPVVRWRSGHECGDLFAEGDDYDGHTLTVETSGHADALAMIEAISGRTCPLGDDCDLTVAWMAGQAEAKASLSDRIVELKTQVGLARLDEGNQRARAEAAEARASALWAALQEVRALVVCANHAAERYPLAWAELTEDYPAEIVKGCRDG